MDLDSLRADGGAADALGGAVVHEARAEHLAPPGIEDHAVARVGADMDVAVDQAGNDQVAARVDLALDGLVIVSADMEDGVALVDDDTVIQDAVLLPIETDDPATPDQRLGRRLPYRLGHGISFPARPRSGAKLSGEAAPINEVRRSRREGETP